MLAAKKILPALGGGFLNDHLLSLLAFGRVLSHTILLFVKSSQVRQ
jgi:hypothetical protein